MKIKAYIASLQDRVTGEHVMGEAEILESLGDNCYRAEVNGVRCKALFNPFICEFFVDDMYSIESVNQ